MASSLRRSTRNHGGTLANEGDLPITGEPKAPGGRGDDGSGSSSALGSLEPFEEVLGRPIVDPWYKSDCELANEDFYNRLEQAGVLHSIFISRCSNMYRDTEALRQLNHWMLPILGDQDPTEIELSPKELKVEAALVDYIGRKNISLRTQAMRFTPWMDHFMREGDVLIRRATFVAYWLSKCVFGEPLTYSVKPLYFHIAIKIVVGVCFPLAPLLLGQLYTQLDLLHDEELVGKPYKTRNKSATMAAGVAARLGGFQRDVPTVYRWVGYKFYDHSLISSLDHESKVYWRPYGVTCRGFAYNSVMSRFRDMKAQNYTLTSEDIRVRRQFVFDQEVPTIMWVAAGEIPTINTFLKARAFAYWSSIAPQVSTPMSPLPGKWHLIRGRRIVPIGTLIAKKGKSGRSKKRKALSSDSPTKASKKKKTAAAMASEVSAPVSNRPVRKTIAERKTFVVPPSSSLPASIVVLKSARDIVYSERRSKQRADTLHRVPLVIPDLDSSSSSSNKTDSSEAAAEDVEDEDAEIDAAKTTFEEETVVAEAASDDEATATDASSREKVTMAEATTDEDTVSMDELEAIGAAVASASNSRSVERASNEHIPAGTVTSAVKVVETEDHFSHLYGTNTLEPSSLVWWCCPHTCSHSCYGIYCKPATIVQEDEAIPTAAEETPGNEEVPVHISDIPEGHVVEDTPIDKNPAVGIDFGTNVTQTGRARAAGGEIPVLADVLAGSDIPVVEEMFAQDPTDDISLEDIADTHDNYDAVLVGAEDHAADTQATDLGVVTPATTHMSPTKTGKFGGYGLILICRPPFGECGLIPICCSPFGPLVGSGNEAVAEERGRHQTTAVESAAMEFDLMSVSSRHAEHIWIFDDVKVEYQGFRVPRGGVRFLEALWEKYGNCSEYLKLVEARAAALRDALSIIAPNPWHLAPARGIFAKPHVGSALYGLLA
uniref:Aminotransferase-like plant mobile domain-containing protein n=1 Tax=Fagus sylvatica TaxID=28930 RepID=A0A2N9G5S4_FAGSY